MVLSLFLLRRCVEIIPFSAYYNRVLKIWYGVCDGSALGLGSFLGFGAAYGTAKSGVGIASMGVMRPELVMKSIVPVVMAGVLGIYGLIIAVIISTGSKSLSLLSGEKHSIRQRALR